MFLTETVALPDGSVEKRRKMHPVYDLLKKGNEVWDGLRSVAKKDAGAREAIEGILGS